MKKLILISIILFFFSSAVTNATKWRTNSSWCHNSSSWYHCHNSGYIPNIDYDDHYDNKEEERELTDQEIIDQLKAWKKCYEITNNSSDKSACYKIEIEWDIYSEAEVLEELKKSKNCYKFYKYKHNKSECSTLMRVQNIYTVEEMKKKTSNYSKCSNIRSFKKDYNLCLEKKKENKKTSTKTTDTSSSKLSAEDKLKQINKKLDILYKKDPKKIIKLWKTIFRYKSKVKKGTSQYILINGIDEKIKSLLEENNKPEKNTFNDSFNKSKKYLERNIYNNINLKQNTFYCECDYDSSKNIDNTGCGFSDNWKYVSRSKRLEWEHVVPAHAFGQSFIEWREWHDSCIDSKWNEFKWRNCVSKVNMEYRYMESDMYNLVPSIWSINAIRSNYSFSVIPWENREFGSCDVEIKDRKIEPKDDIKWDIARIYMYMDITYPGRGGISSKNKSLFDAWDKKDPVSSEECLRYKKIKEIQGNENVVLKNLCE